MSEGGSIEINCGSGGATGVGGDVTISSGDSFGHGGYGDWMQYYDAESLAKMNAGQPNNDKALIKNNPCWPYTAPKLNSISELDISGPTVEEYLASLETVQNDELKVVGDGLITFSAGDTLTFSDNQNWVTVDSSKLEAGHGLSICDQTISLDETIQIQPGTAANPSFSFEGHTNTGMFHTGWSLGFTVNGKVLAEVDEYCGLIVRTSCGDEIEVSAVLERSQERIDHLMNENVILTNANKEIRRNFERLLATTSDLNSRLVLLETSQPWIKKFGKSFFRDARKRLFYRVGIGGSFRK